MFRQTPALESHFKKVTGCKSATLFKNIFQHKCFPMNFAKVLRAPLQNKFR